MLAGLDHLSGAAAPDLVLSGLNEGQNIGPLTNISGTVGAAKTAARQGVPALATSQGAILGSPELTDFPTGVEYVLDWLEENRDDILAGGFAGPPPVVESLNIPTCVEGSVRGLLELAVATDFSSGNPFDVDCTKKKKFTEDAPAFIKGFATLTPITVNDAPVAVDDVGATDADTVLSVPAAGVLTNDTDDFGDVITVTGFDATSTEGATVSVAANGAFSYDPTPSSSLGALALGATLADRFTYTLTDLSGATAIGTVTILVTGV